MLDRLSDLDSRLLTYAMKLTILVGCWKAWFMAYGVFTCAAMLAFMISKYIPFLFVKGLMLLIILLTLIGLVFSSIYIFKANNHVKKLEESLCDNCFHMVCDKRPKCMYNIFCLLDSGYYYQSKNSMVYHMVEEQYDIEDKI